MSYPAIAALEAAIASTVLISGEGVWIRAIPARYLSKPPPGPPYSTDPNPLWPGGTRLTEARYVPLGLCDAYHLAESASTALAEAEQLTDVVESPVFGQVREDMILLQVEWHLSGVLDLCDASVRNQLGLDHGALTSLSPILDAIVATGDADAESLPQRVGRAAYARPDLTAIQYPSARRRGGRNIVVYTERLTPASGSYLRAHDRVRGVSFRIP